MATNPNALITERPVLLLSLDGGGVRGLSTIMILKRIMKTINEGRSPGTELEPWQVFDLMGGTSTGGIIAIMLGRLRMRLEDCENAYLALSERIFTRKRSRFNFLGYAKDFVQADGRFDSHALEAATKEIIAKVSSEDVLLKDPRGPCKVFVVAVRENNSEAALLRSYKNPRMSNFLYDECKVWEACRATSAATTFFAPIQIGKYGQRFVDGAVRYNNPVQLVTREADNLYPGREQFILSIGTGSAPGLPFKGNLKAVVDALKSIATETERTADDFHHAHRYMVQDDLLFRFNVYHGLSHIGLEEYKEISAIADATEVYLDHGETMKKLEACIGRLQASIAEEIPYIPDEGPVTTHSRGMFPQGPPIMVMPQNKPKFSRTTNFQFIEPRRVEYLCYLREPNDRENRGVDIRPTNSVSDDAGLFGNTPFVYIDYGTTDFDGGLSHDLLALHHTAEKATRYLGFPAYWIACSCMPNSEDLQEVAWDMCDIIRAAQRLVLVIWTRKPGPRKFMSIRERLKDWGGRTWSTQPLLLAPRGYPIDIWDILWTGEPPTQPAMSLPRRSLVDATPPHCFSVVRRLIDHFEGTLTLGSLDLVLYLIRLLFSTTTIEYLQGDQSYVLMGFFPFRARPDPTDTAFHALARVLFTNEVDLFLDRFLCIHPPASVNAPWTEAFMLPDVWGTQMREIQPVCRISGMGHAETMFVDGPLGAILEGPILPDQRVPDDPGTGQPRFILLKGNIFNRGEITTSNVPGPLNISLQGSPPPPALGYNHTLIDTFTMTATPFGAAVSPQAILGCAMEGDMYRALLCSINVKTGILYRESIIKLEARVAERLQKVQRVEVATFSQAITPFWRNGSP